MEHVLDRAGSTRVRHAVQVETEVLPLIPDVDAGVPSAFGLLLANLGRAHRDVGAGRVEIGPVRQGLTCCLVRRRYRHGRGEVAAQSKRRVGSHPGERFQLERRDVDTAREHLSRRIEAIHLDQHEVFVERRRRARAHAILNETECVAVHGQQIVGDGQAASGRQHLPRLHADVGGQAPLPVTDLCPLHLQLALRDADTAFLSAVEIERDGEPDRDVVVGAQRLLTA